MISGAKPSSSPTCSIAPHERPGGLSSPTAPAHREPISLQQNLLYFMAAAALLLALVAIARRSARAPPTHQGRTFEILTPQAAPLAHDLRGPAEEYSPPPS